MATLSQRKKTIFRSASITLLASLGAGIILTFGFLGTLAFTSPLFIFSLAFAATLGISAFIVFLYNKISESSGYKSSAFFAYAGWVGVEAISVLGFLEILSFTSGLFIFPVIIFAMMGFVGSINFMYHLFAGSSGGGGRRGIEHEPLVKRKRSEKDTLENKQDPRLGYGSYQISNGEKQKEVKAKPLPTSDITIANKEFLEKLYQTSDKPDQKHTSLPMIYHATPLAAMQSQNPYNNGLDLSSYQVHLQKLFGQNCAVRASTNKKNEIIFVLPAELYLYFESLSGVTVSKPSEGEQLVVRTPVEQLHYFDLLLTDAHLRTKMMPAQANLWDELLRIDLSNKPLDDEIIGDEKVYSPALKELLENDDVLDAFAARKMRLEELQSAKNQGPDAYRKEVRLGIIAHARCSSLFSKEALDTIAKEVNSQSVELPKLPSGAISNIMYFRDNSALPQDNQILSDIASVVPGIPAASTPASTPAATYSGRKEG